MWDHVSCTWYRMYIEKTKSIYSVCPHLPILGPDLLHCTSAQHMRGGTARSRLSQESSCLYRPFSSHLVQIRSFFGMADGQSAAF